MKDKLSKVIKIISGGTPKTNVPEYWNGNIGWLSIVDFGNVNKYVYTSEKTITEKGVKESSTNILDNDDIIISARGTVGALAKIGVPMAFNQSCFGLRALDSMIDSDYLFYYLKNHISNIRKKTQGSVFETINLNTFDQIEIIYPEIEAQKKIGFLLSLIDRKIDCNTKINDNLYQIIQIIYDYWFTQFDFPDENGKPYRSSGGKMLWNESIKKEIPMNWIVSGVKDNELFTIIKPGLETFEEKTYYATAEINGTAISSGNKVTYDNRESRANMQPSINSVWFAKMKNSTKHLFLNKEMMSFINDSILSTGFCGLQCSEYSFEYVSSYIANPLFEIVKDSLAHGATQESVNNDDLENIRIIIPDQQTLSNFHEKTKALYQTISNNIIENKKLSDLRDWLVPMLMNGQATIEE